MEETLFVIDDKIVSSEILTEYFVCDYEKCKGVCCVIGDSGAPLLESEAEDLERNFAHYSPMMCRKGLDTVDAKGFFEIDVDGDCVTPLVAEGEECAYCVRDGEGHNYCAVESSFCRGGSSFRKPISCWLYPIRVSKLTSGMTALNLHRWDICKDAFRKGRKEQVPVFRFARKPLMAAFGEDFYEALEAAYAQLKK